MRIIIQSLVVSFVLHLVYFLGSVISGIIKTINHTPEIDTAFVNQQSLQSEVSFGGLVFSPLFYLLTFIGAALICGLIIISYKKIKASK